MRQGRRVVIGLLLVLLVALSTRAQDRFDTLEAKLQEVAKISPGLNEAVEFTVVNVTIQEFLRGIAQQKQLNINVDPGLNIKVYNNFTNETAANILLFLCKEYDLDIHFVNSIMNFKKFNAPVKKVEVRPYKLVLKYDEARKLLSYDFRNDTLGSVVNAFIDRTGFNVNLSPNIDRMKKVNGKARNVEFERGLREFAFTNGFEVKKDEDGFYVLSIKPEEPEEDPNTTQQRGTTRPKSKYKQNNNRQPRQQAGQGIEVLEVKDSLGKAYLDFIALDVPIGEAINEVSAAMDQEYFLFSEPQGNTTVAISNVTYEEFLNYILQGTEHTFKEDGALYLIGERKLEGLRQTKVVRLNFRSFEEVLNAIPSELKQGVEISEFQELNSLIMSGSSLQITEIESFIHDIDQSVPMVMIEVILVDIQRGRSLRTGVRAGVSDTVTTGGTLFPGLDFTIGSRSINDMFDRLGMDRGPFNLGRVSPNFYVNLSALDAQENVNVRSMPRLSTLNGHEANMRIGQTRYYRLQTQNVVGAVTTNTVVTEQFNSVQADLSITIRPVVSGDDQVTLDIDVEISDFIGEPQPNAPPPSTTSQFTSMVRVGDEEMVLLGGLERIERSESGSGTPFLSRIPIIKWFFSERSKSKRKAISVVFIKPTIIY